MTKNESLLWINLSNEITFSTLPVIKNKLSKKDEKGKKELSIFIKGKIS